MPTERIAMRRVREILRLAKCARRGHSQGLKRVAIGRMRGVFRNRKLPSCYLRTHSRCDYRQHCQRLFKLVGFPAKLG